MKFSQFYTDFDMILQNAWLFISLLPYYYCWITCVVDVIIAFNNKMMHKTVVHIQGLVKKSK